VTFSQILVQNPDKFGTDYSGSKGILEDGVRAYRISDITNILPPFYHHKDYGSNRISLGQTIVSRSEFWKMV